jgi:hypothetical protein
MAPEYAMEGVFSVKSDVFSFGVLVLEILSGQRNGSMYLQEHQHTLIQDVSKRPSFSRKLCFFFSLSLSLYIDIDISLMTNSTFSITYGTAGLEAVERGQGG